MRWCALSQSASAERYQISPRTRDERDEPALGDPVEQALVAAVERGAGAVQHLLVGILFHIQEALREAGAQAHHVALFDRDLVLLQDRHQVVEADQLALVAIMRLEVDHHRAALDRLRRHVLDAEAARADMTLIRLAGGVVERAHDMLVGAIAVVVDHLGLAVAVGVEELADMGEAVPLRRVLQRHHDDVVADDIGVAVVVPAQRVVHDRAAVALGRAQRRRVAARVEHVAAGIVERQRQAEAQPLLHLGDALEHLPGRQQVEAPQLVVGPPIAPGRAGRAALPARVLGHRRSSYVAVIASVAKQSHSSIAPVPAGDCFGALRAPRNDTRCGGAIIQNSFINSTWSCNGSGGPS